MSPQEQEVIRAAKAMRRGIERRMQEPEPFKWITPWGEAARLYRALDALERSKP